MVASRCLHPWPPGGDIRVSYNKAHSLDVWMEQCVQRPNKSFSSYSWKKTYISTHFINFTCITTTTKKNPLDVPLLKEPNFLFSLFPFTETNQIMITGSLEKLKNPLHELNPLSFIQQGLKLSSAWPRCKSQTKAKILKKKNIHHRRKKSRYSNLHWHDARYEVTASSNRIRVSTKLSMSKQTCRLLVLLSPCF